jgi:ABC-type lipoprotein release transport system permease subunit
MGGRLALGANRGQIARTVLGHGFRATLTGVAIGTMMTLIACWVPARRALDVDPVAALRSE